MANEPTRRTTIVVPEGDTGVHIEGRYDDGFKRTFDEGTGLWASTDCLRDYDGNKDAYVEPKKEIKKSTKKASKSTSS